MPTGPVINAAPAVDEYGQVVRVAGEVGITGSIVAAPASDFGLLAKATPSANTVEIRFDDIVAGDLYIGEAPDGTATSAASWKVVRYYRTATGLLTRLRYRTGVVWDSHTSGW